MTGGACVKK